MGTYVVTGAASGIGKAVAEQISEEGHRVVAVDLRNTELTADLSDRESCKKVIEQILERAPEGLDGLVPCAGVGPDVARRELIPLVNYFAVVDLVEGLLAALQQRKGSIVLLSSNSSQMMEYNASFMDAMLDDDRERALEVAADIGGQDAYGGSKQALARWMRRNNQNISRSGVRMNAIAPGHTETGMTAAGSASPEYADAIKQFVESIPIGYSAMPEDQANAVSFLLSDKARFISGAVLFVDGGHDAMFRPDQY